jgi:hypothetical protein
MGAAGGCVKKGRMFFFEKKNQKTFANKADRRMGERSATHQFLKQI